LLGAVAYDPRVVTIWEEFRAYFREQGLPLDFVLFSNYERQVDELLAGHIDIAWNTPLAHVRVQRRTDGQSISLGMRDTDRDFHARVVVGPDAGIEDIRQLSGRRLAVGSADSTQARILPLHFLRNAGVAVDGVKLVPFDSDLGKHGDTGRSEIEVLAAVAAGQVDAGCVGDLVWVTEQAAGRLSQERVRSLWVTPAFDHCMFDALPSLAPPSGEAFQRALFAMDWHDPRHRLILELEGLKQWLPPRETGYQSLRAALEENHGW
jgi:ABC-type phosphate/phosphonate transport system substrate-binding protein